eukprot:TRINITY_DN7305_c0_g1_i1.p1 TRINITY_DN7305_c0_g1~~TRINITY_DN7305_c0_g1_i1.p1  ORF type:complete len:712 (-),score=208.53 TRINITY_DN7305_c0_g1_i1:98-2233(-)
MSLFSRAENPIDGAQRETMRNVTRHVCDMLQMNCVDAAASVVYERLQHKAERRRHEEKDKAGGSGCWVRDKGLYKTAHPVFTGIIHTELFDEGHAKPSLSFVIFSKYKKRQATARRSYKEFEALHKKLNKKVPPTVKLPSYRADDTAMMKAMSGYLTSLAKFDQVAMDPDFHRFLAVEKRPDVLGDLIFGAAFELTKNDLGVFQRIVYDEPPQAMQQLALEQIRRALWSSVVGACPSSPRARRESIKVAQSSMASIIGEQVAPAWDETRASLCPVRTLAESGLAHPAYRDCVATVLREVRAHYAKALASPAEAQAVALGKTLARALDALAPALAACAAPLATELARATAAARQLVECGGDPLAQDFCTRFHGAAAETTRIISSELAPRLPSLLRELEPAASGAAVVRALLSLLARLPDVASAALELLIPEVFMPLLAKLLEARDTAIKSGPCAPGPLARRLDHMAWAVLKTVDEHSFFTPQAGESAWFALLGSASIGGGSSATATTADQKADRQQQQDAYKIAGVIEDAARRLQHCFNRGLFKRCALDFGQLLYCCALEAAQGVGTDPAAWKNAVDAAFIKSYDRAFAHARRLLRALLRCVAAELVVAPALCRAEACVCESVDMSPDQWTGRGVELLRAALAAEGAAPAPDGCGAERFVSAIISTNCIMTAARDAIRSALERHVTAAFDQHLWRLAFPADDNKDDSDSDGE